MNRLSIIDFFIVYILYNSPISKTFLIFSIHRTTLFPDLLWTTSLYQLGASYVDLLTVGYLHHLPNFCLNTALEAAAYVGLPEVTQTNLETDGIHGNQLSHAIKNQLKAPKAPY